MGLKKTKGLGRAKRRELREKPSKRGAGKRGRKTPGKEKTPDAEKTIERAGSFEGSRGGKKHRTGELKNASSDREAVYFGGAAGEGGRGSGGRKRPTPTAAYPPRIRNGANDAAQFRPRASARVSTRKPRRTELPPAHSKAFPREESFSEGGGGAGTFSLWVFLFLAMVPPLRAPRR
jgi:hypothetical protein